MVAGWTRLVVSVGNASHTKTGLRAEDHLGRAFAYLGRSTYARGPNLAVRRSENYLARIMGNTEVVK